MWAGHCLLLTFLLAAVLEVAVTLVAPSSIERALAGWRNGGAKHPSLWSSCPQDGLREIRWKNALQLGKGATSSLWLAVGWGHGLRDSSGLGAGGCLWWMENYQDNDTETPQGAHINSDTPIYLVFDFHLNIIWAPETAWLKNMCKWKNTSKEISLQIWEDALPQQVADGCLWQRGMATGIIIPWTHQEMEMGTHTPTRAVWASW